MSMKKKVKIIIGLILISIIGYLGFSIGKKLKHKKEVAERIQEIPEFSFKDLNGKLYTRNQISAKHPKLFIYFNSDCDFCQVEGKQIQEHLEELKNVQILFISFEEVTGINSFAEKYHLINQKNITFLKDYESKFPEIFEANTIPFILLYSKDNQLLRKFKGATKIENIIAHLPTFNADSQDFYP